MTKKISLVLFGGLMITLMAMFVMREQGVAVFSYGEITWELSLTHFYFAAIAVFILLYWLFRFIGKILRLPTQLKLQKQQKTRLEILNALDNTLIHAALHDWDSAIKTSTRHIKDSPIKKGQHSYTAYCANEIGHIDMRTTHVNQLRAIEGGASAANLLEAGFMLQDKKPEKALSLLEDESIEDVSVLNYYCQAFLQIKDTQAIEHILPKLFLRTQKQPQKYQAIQNTCYQCLHYLIETYHVKTQAESLAELWKTYNKIIQIQPSLLEQFVHRLNQHKQDVLAEQIIVSSLQQNWNERLVQTFGLLQLDNVEQRIKIAQQWSIEHKDSASLLLTLGRLHKQLKHWGQAKNYLESSLSRQPLVATYAELTDLHEQLNEVADAHRCAKKGLYLATHD